MSRVKIEVTREISSLDLEIINDFYLPIIGTIGYAIYLNLYKRFKKGYFQIFNLDLDAFLNKLNIKQNEWEETRNVLEAISLFQTYYNEDKDEYLFLLQKPLDISDLLGNSLLKSKIQEKISEADFEELINRYKKEFISKDRFKNISKKFYEIFPYDLKKEEFIIEQKEEKSTFSYKNVLNTEDFLKQLTQKDPKPSLVKGVNLFLENNDLSQEAINTILNFCYLANSNSSISLAYFKKIAKDLIDKKVILPDEIKSELREVLEYKKQQKQVNILNDFISPQDNSNIDLSFDNTNKKRKILNNNFKGLIDEK
ncbi:replication initiation and membrane attachment family protein [Mesomycoplasma neurolyticum]|uniref:Chromosome replication initiation and membrane attachment protein n=1 Tax=Mesomycoplasma neurolyticum TaxID=2120 RepID=A0A449A658_9BACT|nr:hypothetical protein [Mesomycoplasma neurolyticum]VEU59707.1 Chromosome replication initiation and membrane attachment protein [Mesomycoplasma neurolyticum]